MKAVKPQIAVLMVLMVLMALVTLIAGCSQPGLEAVPPTSPQARPADFPAAFYEQAAASGQQVLKVDTSRSLVSITVRRAGALANLGHDHVIGSRQLQGYVAPRLGRADLYVALDSLSVDEPALRAAAGLDTQPSAADIEGTRANMLSKVLQTQLHPFASVQVRTTPDADGEVVLVLKLTVHGVTRGLSVPARIVKEQGAIRISGALSIDQSDFGITPFSILGGAIQVRDRLDLSFEVHADPMKRESGS
ncbi:YceI family protein [Comamonas sp. Tr-654]|uniref:YceI family protein n=1 Tax=Comamonas sp. Tr-654 TaxID=2608341 RepID=UPI00142477B6|nr:YceI family protein [Comamonas sp. Tr-654]NIF82209.1 YceI family protein [Comamonas sp. Tr-654]